MGERREAGQTGSAGRCWVWGWWCGTRDPGPGTRTPGGFPGVAYSATSDGFRGTSGTCFRHGMRASCFPECRRSVSHLVGEDMDMCFSRHRDPGPGTRDPNSERFPESGVFSGSGRVPRNIGNVFQPASGPGTRNPDESHGTSGTCRHGMRASYFPECRRSVGYLVGEDTDTCFSRHRVPGPGSRVPSTRSSISPECRPGMRV